MACLHLRTGEIGLASPALQDRPVIMVGFDFSAPDVSRGDETAKMIPAGNRVARRAAASRTTRAGHFGSIDPIQPSAPGFLAPDIIAVVYIGCTTGECVGILGRGNGWSTIPEPDHAKGAGGHDRRNGPESPVAQFCIRYRRPPLLPAPPAPAHQSRHSFVTLSSPICQKSASSREALPNRMESSVNR